MPNPLNQKRNRILISLIVLLAGLLILAILITNKPVNAPVFSDLNRNLIKQINITKNTDESFRFEKSVGGWYLVEPFHRKADSSRIQILLSTQTIPKGKIYNSAEFDLESAGLDPARATLTLDSHTFRFGDREFKGDRRYLQHREKVTLAADIVFPIIQQGIPALVERNLLPPGVIKIQAPNYKLDKSSGKWRSQKLDDTVAENLVGVWLGQRVHDLLTWPLTDEKVTANADQWTASISTSESHAITMTFFVLPELVLVHPEKARYAMAITREQFSQLTLDNP